jgi:radical SAM-linked protein
MRFVVEYTREERVKYISHLDLMRAMQRTIRRAEIPIAYSQGFHPHPIMAFASALPVGVTSEGEYMDMELCESIGIPELKEKLNKALPKGITAKEAGIIDEKAPSLMSLIERADYRIIADDPGLDWKSGIAAFLEKTEIWVEKKGKKGISTINLKEGVYDIRLGGEHNGELYLSLHAGSSGNLKPELVVGELLKGIKTASQAAEAADPDSGQDTGQPVPMSIHRIGLYFKQNGKWVTPLALNRN